MARTTAPIVTELRCPPRREALDLRIAGVDHVETGELWGTRQPAHPVCLATSARDRLPATGQSSPARVASDTLSAMNANPETRPSVRAETRPSPDDSGRPLVYLAAERTLLSWVRAAVSLVVLGFAVDRFGLLLAVQVPDGREKFPRSSLIGIGLIACGVAISVASAIRYARFEQRYERGDVRPGPGIRMAIALCGLLAVVGAGLAIYLWRAAA